MIANIQANKYHIKSQHGYWRPFKGIKRTLLNKVQHHDNVTPQHCDIIAKSCNMCARGALLLSKIDKFNNVEWYDFLNDYNSSEIPDIDAC